MTFSAVRLGVRLLDQPVKLGRRLCVRYKVLALTVTLAAITCFGRVCIVALAPLISVVAAASNFLRGASWGACVDISGEHAGTISACMNTAGQVGGVLSPVILAAIPSHTSYWSLPLYLIAGLYLLGAASWGLVDANKPIFPEAKVVV